MHNQKNNTIDSLSQKVIQTVTTCVVENKGRTLELMDGSIVRLTPKQAKNFIDVHDELNESSQASFRLMLVETKKSFEGINTFCKEKKR